MTSKLHRWHHDVCAHSPPSSGGGALFTHCQNRYACLHFGHYNMTAAYFRHARPCIICEAPTGSREHLFPASLGGRRKDAGIYCAAHNKAFGRTHVAVLLATLEVISARLGVVPDGEKKVRPAKAFTYNGERYQLVGHTLELAPPPHLSRAPELLGKDVELTFSSQSQMDIWRNRQEKANFVFTESHVVDVRTPYFTRLPKASITLPEGPFLRAAAYIALTYLAHYHPDVARQPGVACIKEVIACEAPLGKRAWWEAPSALDQLPPRHYEWAHTVAIAIDPASNEITALVSFFGEFVCGVVLGSARHLDASLVVTHIDPLAKNRKNDINVARPSNPVRLQHDRTAGSAYIGSLACGNIESPFRKVHRLMELKHAREQAALLMPQLVALRDCPPEVRKHEVLEILKPQRQRLMNALSQCVSFVIPRVSDEELRATLASAIANDPTSSDGLTPAGKELLDGMVDFLGWQLDAEIQDGTLAVDRLVGRLVGEQLHIDAGTYLSVRAGEWLQRLRDSQSKG